MTTPLILVADDNPDIREFLEQAVLGLAGYDVRSAEDGLQALQMARQEWPHLVITDQQMPGLTGLELVQRLGKIGARPPCILITGEATIDLALQALQLGVEDMLVKPFEPDQLLASIDRLLSEAQRPGTASRGGAPASEGSEAVQRRYRELETLAGIGRNVTSMLHLDEVLEAVVQAAVEITGAEESSLLLVDEDSGELYMRASKNFDDEFAQTFRIAVQDSLAGKVIETGQPVMLDESTPKKIKTSYLVHSLLYVPLKVRDRTLGVLGVDNRTPGKALTDHDEFVVTALADYASIAIENAQLYQRAETRRQELETILREVENGVIVIDEEERLLLINNSAREAVAQEGTTLGQAARDCFSDPALLELIQGPGTPPRRVELELEDGRVFNAQRTPIEGVGQAIIMQEITHLKELDKVKSEFVTTVSHDLRSPLTAILGYIDLIERAGQTNPKQAEFIQRVRISVDQITTLIDDLLDLGRIEAGLDSAKEEVNIGQLVAELALAVRGSLQAQGLALEVHTPPDLPAVRGDPIRLKQMIGNLLDNAAKYACEGDEVYVEAEAEDDQVILRVRDTGPGIPQADQPFLFDKFYRGSNVPEGQPGTGLGLSIVKSIVENHNGRIWVDSRLGEGTTFSVLLPTSG